MPRDHRDTPPPAERIAADPCNPERTRRGATVVRQHSRNGHNRSNGLDEIEMSPRHVDQAKHGPPEAPQGGTLFSLISLRPRRASCCRTPSRPSARQPPHPPLLVNQGLHCRSAQ